MCPSQHAICDAPGICVAGELRLVLAGRRPGRRDQEVVDRGVRVVARDRARVVAEIAVEIDVVLVGPREHGEPLRIDRMDDHVATGEILHQMKHITHEFAIPEDACPTYIKTYSLLNNLVNDIFLHVYTENSILFPRYLAK